MFKNTAFALFGLIALSASPIAVFAHSQVDGDDCSPLLLNREQQKAFSQLVRWHERELTEAADYAKEIADLKTEIAEQRKNLVLRSKWLTRVFKPEEFKEYKKATGDLKAREEFDLPQAEIRVRNSRERIANFIRDEAKRRDHAFVRLEFEEKVLNDIVCQADVCEKKVAHGLGRVRSMTALEAVDFLSASKFISIVSSVYNYNLRKTLQKIPAELGQLEDQVRWSPMADAHLVNVERMQKDSQRLGVKVWPDLLFDLGGWTVNGLDFFSIFTLIGQVKDWRNLSKLRAGLEQVREESAESLDATKAELQKLFCEFKDQCDTFPGAEWPSIH